LQRDLRERALCCMDCGAVQRKWCDSLQGRLRLYRLLPCSGVQSQDLQVRGDLRGKWWHLQEEGGLLLRHLRPRRLRSDL